MTTTTNPFDALQVSLSAQIYLEPSRSFRAQLWTLSGVFGFTLLLCLAILWLRWRRANFWVYRLSPSPFGNWIMPNPHVCWLLFSGSFVAIAQVFIHYTFQYETPGSDLSGAMLWRCIIWLPLFIGGLNLTWATTLAPILSRQDHGSQAFDLARHPHFVSAAFVSVHFAAVATILPYSIASNVMYNRILRTGKVLGNVLSEASKAFNAGDLATVADLVVEIKNLDLVATKQKEELFEKWRDLWIIYAVFSGLLTISRSLVSPSPVYHLSITRYSSRALADLARVSTHLSLVARMAELVHLSTNATSIGQEPPEGCPTLPVELLCQIFSLATVDLNPHDAQTYIHSLAYNNRVFLHAVASHPNYRILAVKGLGKAKELVKVLLANKGRAIRVKGLVLEIGAEAGTGKSKTVARIIKACLNLQTLELKLKGKLGARSDVFGSALMKVLGTSCRVLKTFKVRPEYSWDLPNIPEFLATWPTLVELHIDNLSLAADISSSIPNLPNVFTSLKVYYPSISILHHLLSASKDTLRALSFTVAGATSCPRPDLTTLLCELKGLEYLHIIDHCQTGSTYIDDALPHLQNLRKLHVGLQGYSSPTLFDKVVALIHIEVLMLGYSGDSWKWSQIPDFLGSMMERKRKGCFKKLVIVTGGGAVYAETTSIIGAVARREGVEFEHRYDYSLEL
ncbi:hypothetical protein P7C70_g6674, partial [Phenoliferia sp. Uapishka_3]